MYQKLLNLVGLGLYLLTGGSLEATQNFFTYEDLEQQIYLELDKVFVLNEQSDHDRDMLSYYIRQLMSKYRSQFNDKAYTYLTSDEVKQLLASLRYLVRTQMAPEVAYSFAYTEVLNYLNSSNKALPYAAADIAKTIADYIFYSLALKLSNSPNGNVELFAKRLREKLKADFPR